MSSKAIINFLKISCFFIFLGRAYQHLFWDAPFRSLFWDQSLLEPVVNTFLNMEWQDYVTNLDTDRAIQSLTRAHGFLYLICAIVSLLIKQGSKKWMRVVITIGGISLVFLSMLLTKDKFYHFAMFFEHAYSLERLSYC